MANNKIEIAASENPKAVIILRGIILLRKIYKLTRQIAVMAIGIDRSRWHLQKGIECFEWRVFSILSKYLN